MSKPQGKIKGVITALVTPFKNDQVDFISLEKLVQAQVKAGVQGFVINGTTGESPTLTGKDRREIFLAVRKMVPKDFPLIMGTGSNSTAKSVEETRGAESLGADAVLVVVPYYNKPPQRGLIEHFTTIANAAKIPNILYNVPGRTITSLELNSIKQLSLHPQIIGIKEASGNVGFAKEIRAACGDDFVLLSGDDGTYDEFMKAGGDGVISVASHIIPQAFLDRNVSKFKTLVDYLFKESNPIPVKMALYLMGLLQTPECRLPLVTMSDENSTGLKKLLLENGLIK
jgi:4-hydroxy-tetrahydrodipicolinate synthase